MDHMNPMNYPPVIVDMILQHFTANEMLGASLVSQSWYSSIGESLQFRKKVNICIDEDTYQFGPFGDETPASNPRGDVTSMITSSRKYQRLFVDSITYHEEDLDWMEKQKWKTISFKVFNSFTSAQYVRYLGAFGGSVDQMTLKSLKVVTAAGERARVTRKAFPNLTKLIMRRCDPDALLPLTTPHPKLDRFIWNTSGGNDEPAVSAFLGENPTVKYLTISSAEMLSQFGGTSLIQLLLNVRALRIATPEMANFTNVMAHNVSTLKAVTMVQLENVAIEGWNGDTAAYYTFTSAYLSTIYRKLN